jgi:hypothetical protein
MTSTPHHAGPAQHADAPTVVYLTWLNLAPVVLLAGYGASWIILHANGGRGSTHTLFQALALVENTAALLLRRRKPAGALLGILAVYLFVDLEPTTLPPLLFALLTVAELSDRRRTIPAVALTVICVLGMPLLHGDTIDLPAYIITHLTAVGMALTLGLTLRARLR